MGYKQLTLTTETFQLLTKICTKFHLLFVDIKCTTLLCGKDSVDRVEQTIKGCAIVSKRAVDVMSCEVNRLLVLAASSVIPVSYCVPRKVVPNTKCTDHTYVVLMPS